MSHHPIYARIAAETSLTESGFRSSLLPDEYHELPKPSQHKVLASFIYAAYHLGSEGAVARFHAARNDAQHTVLLEVIDTELMDSARSRFQSLTYRDHGWSRTEAPSDYRAADITGRVFLERDGLHLDAPEDRVTQSGDFWSVAMPRFKPNAVRGWSALHCLTDPQELSGPRIRLYLSTRDTSSHLECVERVAELLDSKDIPYALKFGVTREHLDRPDGIVIYMAERHWSATLEGAITSLGLPVGAATPGFAKKITEGISMAHDLPPHLSHLSLGQHRSAAAASGLLEVGSQGSAEDRLQGLIRAAISAGIDPEDPSSPLSPRGVS